eukprot:956858-Rhodomonas_salina.1
MRGPARGDTMDDLDAYRSVLRSRMAGPRRVQVSTPLAYGRAEMRISQYSARVWQGLDTYKSALRSRMP